RINSENVVLKAEKLTFAYDEKSPENLNGFDFTLHQGEKVAIIGRSGTGKSSFLNLVQGALLPTAGKVPMNGVEVENLRPPIPEITSMLNQKARLFSTTILNNIRLGNQDASD
ncbi:ATP-binding protein, partial [Listeria monocytogenes]|uniref:ATP-binding cassette domain-containing protein n=1 Tax=Listeria monocytogenes TaxID=1639 RepID=UPI0006A45FA8